MATDPTPLPSDPIPTPPAPSPPSNEAQHPAGPGFTWKATYEPGPFKRTRVTKLEVSPLTVTITHDEDSTHVPPPDITPPTVMMASPCAGCGGHPAGPDPFAGLISMIAPKLVEILTNIGNRSRDDDDEDELDDEDPDRDPRPS